MEVPRCNLHIPHSRRASAELLPPPTPKRPRVSMREVIYIFVSAIAFGAAASRLAVVHARTACLPLEAATLKISRSDLNELLDPSQLRGIVGVVAASERGVSGACGTVCEFSLHDAVIAGDECAVRAIGFARFRSLGVAENSPLPIHEIEPILDAEPEDDELLREKYGLTDRRTQLLAMEMRTHLVFQNVEKRECQSP